MATLAAYLNALGGDSVHIVTVNDYLARRDADWMGQIYRLLGMTVGVVVPGQAPGEKREAYRSDVVYGTNNEFGFDYLRDNMAFSLSEKAQPRLAYAIVDEVDSILIDEARTPLIISGPSEESSELYQRINRLIPKLERQEREPADEDDHVPGDYLVDEKTRARRHLTESGYRRVEELLSEEGLLGRDESLYDTANVMLLHHFDAALRAHSLYHRDVHYLVRGGEVVIVDEFTGRTMAGRRWSDGLHQAVEAKEGVEIRQGEPDPRLDHLPELLPALRQARGDDRDRGHRGGRVPADLRAGGGGDPDPPPDGPGRPGRPRLPQAGREGSGPSSRRSGNAGSGGSRSSSAPPPSRPRSTSPRASGARGSPTRC